MNKRTQLIEYLDCLNNSAKSYEEKEKISQIKKIISKKLGLVFEKKVEQNFLKLEKGFTPTFIFEKKVSNINKNASTFGSIIEGDNLISLTTLTKIYSKKIDIIYIDPPYNTGNKDFEYNDHIIDPNDGYIHSKWLSLMEDRLKIAKNLLSENGVIFISIDNNESHRLKMLCDDIFSGFYDKTLIIELTKTQGMKVKSAQNGSVAKNYEYILMYSKKPQPVKNIKYDFTNNYDDHYKLFQTSITEGISTYDNIVNVIKQKSDLIEEFNKLDLNVSVSNFEIVMEFSSVFKEWIHLNAHLIFRESMVGPSKKPEIIKWLNKNAGNKSIAIKDGKYILFQTSTGKTVQLQSLKMSLNLSDNYLPKYGRTSIRGDLWKGFYKDMMNIKKEGGVIYKNGKKPKRLIKQLISWVETNNSHTVLDFFAGSGTTGEAVHDLNIEDGGKRSFILCNTKESSTKEPEKNVCRDITAERFKKINLKNKNSISYKYFVASLTENPTYNELVLASKSLLEIKFPLYDFSKNETIVNGEKYTQSIDDLEARILPDEFYSY